MLDTQARPAKREIWALVVLDASLRYADVLRNGIGPGALSVMLDRTADGLSQVARAVGGRKRLSSLTIVSHGVPGGLDLGQTRLDTAGVLQNGAAMLAAIGASLAPNGLLQLVACDVAHGPDGAMFLQALANAIGRPVCASTRPLNAGPISTGWELDAWASPHGGAAPRAATVPIAPSARAAYAQALSGSITAGTASTAVNVGYLLLQA